MKPVLLDDIQQYLRAKDAYYNGTPIMSDAEFDKLEEEIRAQYPAHPALSVVGAKVVNGTKVTLPTTLLSTQKALNQGDLLGWASRLPRNIAHVFEASEKLDGISCYLEYENGVLVKASTRGDGSVGQDILPKVRQIAPAVIPEFRENPKVVGVRGEHVIRVVGVRGELVMSFANFERWNALLASRGEEPASNPRNAVSGAISSDSMDLEKLKLIDLVTYQLYLPTDVCETFSKQLSLLEACEFKVVDHHTVLDDVSLEADAAWWTKNRGACKYPLDGVVYRLDDQRDYEEQGATSHHNKGMVAFKFPPTEAIVKVRSIEWSCGAKEISPVLEIDPVLLDGAVVSRVSGHNVRNLILLDALPGKTVKVVRSGAVIPRAYHRDAAVE